MWQMSCNNDARMKSTITGTTGITCRDNTEHLKLSPVSVIHTWAFMESSIRSSMLMLLYNNVTGSESPITLILQ